MIKKQRMLEYGRRNFGGVLHTTLNPDGPGVVRIHLIPPVVRDEMTLDEELGSGIAIINGQDVIPVNPSWTILLCEFIKEVNKYSGRAVSDAEAESILKNTARGVAKVFPLAGRKMFKEDIYRIMNAFTQIARGEIPEEDIGYMSMSEYAPYMRAPHRMDLLVSSMKKDGAWHCNLKCVHCYAAGQELAEERELSTDEWKKVIDRCREAGIPQITFTGGEPTLREDLPELIDHAQWFITRLNTNGVALTPELCEKFREVSLDSVQITFYSADEDIHNRLVGANGYAATVRGLENALAAGLNISVNTPLCTLNRDYVRTLEFLHEKGVTYVTCSGLITTGNAAGEPSEKLQLSTDGIKAVLKDAAEYCYAHDMEISFTSPGWVENEFCEELGISVPSCGACLSNMAVTPSGNVVPCQSWLSDGSMGSMISTPWEKIWESEACSKIRNYSAKMLGKCPLRIYKAGEGTEGGSACGSCGEGGVR